MALKLKPKKIRSITEKSTEYEITADILRDRFNLPKDSRVFVEVPGGGDWSNTELHLDQHPIKIIVREQIDEVTRP